MKKFLTVILCFMMACASFAACAEEVESSSSPSSSSSQQEAEESTIAYFAVIDGEKTSIPNGMYKEDGKYPAKYTEGKETDIDDLQDYSNDDYSYEFEGWFTDKEVSKAFEGITKDTTGTLTLYAKVVKTEIVPPQPQTYAIEYFAIIDGATEETSIPALLYKSGVTYANTYTEGTEYTISVLESSKKEGNTTYKFGGWFTDKACSQAITAISATQTGKVTLYAKITTEVDPPEDDEKNWTKNY